MSASGPGWFLFKIRFVISIENDLRAPESFWFGYLRTVSILFRVCVSVDFIRLWPLACTGEVVSSGLVSNFKSGVMVLCWKMVDCSIWV